MNTLYAMFLVLLAAGGLFYSIWFGSRHGCSSEHSFGVALIGFLWAAALLGMAAAAMHKGG